MFAFTWPPCPRTTLATLGLSAYESTVLDAPAGQIVGSVGVGATLDFPGPAAGSIRVYGIVTILPESALVPTGARIDLLPSNTRVWNTSATANAQGFPMPPIGNGETLRFTNGVAVACSVYATYRDIPATGITLVRLNLSNVLAPLLPVPPAGFVNRFLLIGTESSSAARALSNRINACNADSIGQVFEVRQGAAWLGRVSLGTGTNSFIVGMSSWHTFPSSDPIEARVSLAVATVAPNLVGAYETLPL